VGFQCYSINAKLIQNNYLLIELNDFGSIIYENQLRLITIPMNVIKKRPMMDDHHEN